MSPVSIRKEVQLELDRRAPKRAAKILSSALDRSPIPINTAGHATISRLAIQILMAYREMKIPPNSDLVVIFDRLTSSSRHQRSFKGHTARKGEKRRNVVQSAALIGLRRESNFNKAKFARRANCSEKYIRMLIEQDAFWEDVDREMARQEREKQQATNSDLVAVTRAALRQAMA